jgi:hypothetical protein
MVAVDPSRTIAKGSFEDVHSVLAGRPAGFLGLRLVR